MTDKREKKELPDVPSLKRELDRAKRRSRLGSALKSTLYALIVVAAVSFLVSMLWMPVLRTYGHSMKPTLNDGDVIISVKSNDFSKGDLIAFYSNNKLLVKRVIAGPGDWVTVEKDGAVFVNGERLSEPYIKEPAFGNTNVEFPYQVPESCWFVMGDHRSTSIDSRNTSVGCVYEEQVVGKVIFRVWPLRSFGRIEG